MIALKATAQMAADKEEIGLSRVHMYHSNLSEARPYKIFVYSVLECINTSFVLK